MVLYLRQNDKTNTLVQQNFSFIALLSDTGGVSSSIMAILGTIALFFNNQWFMQTVLANLFLVKKKIGGGSKNLIENQ